MRTWRRVIMVGAVALGAAAVLGGCASERGARPVPAVGLDPAAAPQKIEDVAGVNVRLFRDGRVYIGGQPDSLALRALAERGVKTVVNLRTPTEMADRKNVPYDEPALARELGLEYVSVPLGGTAFPYSPAATDTFAAVVARTPGPVFLHCTVGGRASYLWAAYLVRHHGWAPQAALDRGMKIGIGSDVLADLTGQKFEVVPRK